MPAAAVIPAPIAYIKVVAVKKLVVGSRQVGGGYKLFITKKLVSDIPSTKKNKFDPNTFHYNNFCVNKNCPETCSFSAKIEKPSFLEINILYLDYFYYYQQNLLLT